ncbi:hypothetical protein HanIR_Chr04g0158721 [Helianthus annuus]|nr:hypothetical protein HanIR_Chr04g0158721 [Helianthus annuus]
MNSLYLFVMQSCEPAIQKMNVCLVRMIYKQESDSNLLCSDLLFLTMKKHFLYQIITKTKICCPHYIAEIKHIRGLLIPHWLGERSRYGGR